ncbi:hypothetical protein CAP35_03670 [Chitinophagaceae bacterium IBVUCB1]|nr:hypothetical protein CAP35_03670 [Chitinophagaceae bacterium IBVUCB1]
MYWLPCRFFTSKEKQSLKNRLLIVGLFSNPDKAPATQAFVLANALKRHGYEVNTVSGYVNRWLRLFDITFTMIARANRYDTAIVQFYSGSSFIWQYIAAIIAKLYRKKLLFTVHGGGVPDKLKSSIGKRYLSLLQKADLITVPSQYLQYELNRYNITSLLIENIISLDNYKFQNKQQIKPSVLWMRAFSDIYNPLMAVRVVNELKEKYPEVKMVMGGPDLGMLHATQKLISDLKLETNIELVGFINIEKKNHYASVCDVYISTNKIDNAPVTFLEMWALGLLVISTDVGGIQYLVDNNQTGVIVPDEDYKQMAAAIGRLIEDRYLAQTIIQRARDKAKTYDEAQVVQKWEQLLGSLNK